MGARMEMLRELEQVEKYAGIAATAATETKRSKTFADLLAKRGTSPAVIAFAQEQLNQAQLALSDLESTPVGYSNFLGSEMRGAREAAIACREAVVRNWTNILAIANLPS